MKVGELIKALQKFDPELEACYSDYENGTMILDEPSVEDVYWVSMDKRRVLTFNGLYPFEIADREKADTIQGEVVESGSVQKAVE